MFGVRRLEAQCGLFIFVAKDSFSRLRPATSFQAGMSTVRKLLGKICSIPYVGTSRRACGGGGAEKKLKLLPRVATFELL